jgi:hypothetical protein
VLNLYDGCENLIENDTHTAYCDWPVFNNQDEDIEKELGIYDLDQFTPKI